MKNKGVDNFLLIIGFLAIGVVMFFISYPLGLSSVVSIFEEQVYFEHTITKEVPVGKEEIFLAMAQIENYPKIFPKNILSINIINQTNEVIFAKETIRHQEFQKEVLIKHTLIPYEKHIIEILEGDALGTVIIISFQEQGPKTKVTIEMVIHIDNIKIESGSLPKGGFQESARKAISNFAESIYS